MGGALVAVYQSPADFEYFDHDVRKYSAKPAVAFGADAASELPLSGIPHAKSVSVIGGRPPLCGSDIDYAADAKAAYAAIEKVSGHVDFFVWRPLTRAEKSAANWLGYSA